MTFVHSRGHNHLKVSLLDADTNRHPALLHHDQHEDILAACSPPPLLNMQAP